MSDSPADAWFKMWRSWSPSIFAPEQLAQPIDSGWSFGNVTINERNPSAPQTEQAILAEESYGRQVGKLLDAMAAIVDSQADRLTNPAYVEITELKAKIDGVKRTAAIKRIGQFRRDLELLSKSDDPEDRTAYELSTAALRALLFAPAARSP